MILTLLFEGAVDLLGVYRIHQDVDWDVGLSRQYPQDVEASEVRADEHCSLLGLDERHHVFATVDLHIEIVHCTAPQGEAIEKDGREGMDMAVGIDEAGFAVVALGPANSA